jgi:hypothetical protein
MSIASSNREENSRQLTIEEGQRSKVKGHTRSVAAG